MLFINTYGRRERGPAGMQKKPTKFENNFGVVAQGQIAGN